MQPTKDTRQLNWFLAWAVVFCDIGTSVYYVPGILYGHVKDSTPFFVLLTTGGFIFLLMLPSLILLFLFRIYRRVTR